MYVPLKSKKKKQKLKKEIRVYKKLRLAATTST